MDGQYMSMKMIPMIRVILIGLLLCVGASISYAVEEPPVRTKDWKFII
jgi:hypothetical protein